MTPSWISWSCEIYLARRCTIDVWYSQNTAEYQSRGSPWPWMLVPSLSLSGSSSLVQELDWSLGQDSGWCFSFLVFYCSTNLDYQFPTRVLTIGLRLHCLSKGDGCEPRGQIHPYTGSRVSSSDGQRGPEQRNSTESCLFGYTRSTCTVLTGMWCKLRTTRKPEGLKCDWSAKFNVRSQTNESRGLLEQDQNEPTPPCTRYQVLPTIYLLR